MNPARTLKSIETTRRSALAMLNGLVELPMPGEDFGEALRGLGAQGVAAVVNGRMATVGQIRARLGTIQKYEGLSQVLADSVQYAITAIDLWTLSIEHHELALADAACS